MSTGSLIPTVVLCTSKM